jgi:hypothetical protein
MKVNSNGGFSLGGRKARRLRREYARKNKLIGDRPLGKRRFENINGSLDSVMEGS